MTLPPPPAVPPRAAPSELARRARLGLRLALLASAATAGVVVGFGRAAGGAWRPFTAAGRRALDLEAAHHGSARVVATLAGIVLHVIVVTLWTLVFALVAARWRGARRWGAAAAVSLAALAADVLLAPDVWRLGDGPGVTTPQRVALFVALSLSLALGMRVALPSSPTD